MLMEVEGEGWEAGRGQWEGDPEKQRQVEKPEVLVSFDLGSFHYALCPLTGFLEPPPPPLEQNPVRWLPVRIRIHWNFS